MFINCKKNLAIRIGSEIINIPAGFIGGVPDKLVNHWMIQAALKDGTIVAPTGSTDKKLEQADAEANQKAEQFDVRPDAEANQKAEQNSKKDAPKK